MHVRWLRLLWALAAFTPLVAISTPPLAYSIGLSWLAFAAYLWPASWAAHQFGIEPLTARYTAVAAVYCAAIGALAAFVVSRLLKLPPHIERRRAVMMALVVWLPVGIYVAYQIVDYKGLLAFSTRCPGRLRILESQCAGISDLKEYPLESFIDSSYLARFQARPGVVRAIAASSQLIAIDPANVPDSVWKQPPLWWTPRKGAGTHVYMTPNFSFDGRGGDGDYYLFIEDGDANQVFAIVKYNF